MDLNASANGLQRISGASSYLDSVGSLVGVAVFVSIFVGIFFLSKNFRSFICGAVVTTILLLNYLFSSWVGVSANENNFEPFKWVCYVLGFVALSIISGIILRKFKFIKNLEKKIEEMNKPIKEE